MKIARKIVIAVLLFIALFSITVMALPDRHLKLLGVKLTQALTGYELHIGTLELERSLNPQLVLSDVALKNPDSAKQEYLFRATHLDASIQLLSLLSGRLHVNSISSTDLVLHLEKSKADNAGLQNMSNPLGWKFPRLSIDTITARNTRIDYVDATRGQMQVLTFDTVSFINDNSGTEPVLTATGVWNGQPISMTLALDAVQPSEATTPDADVLQFRFEATSGVGELTAVASLTVKNRNFDLSLQSAHLASEFGQAHLSGTIVDILGSATASIAVTASTPDMAIVTHLFGQNMPPEWGPIETSAVLEGASGQYALNQLDATMSSQSSAHVVGAIGSLYPFDDMRLEVDVSLSTLAEISAFTRKPLPDIGKLVGTGIVSWQDGHLSLADARATHNSDYGTAVFTGKIGDLIHFNQVRLRADADLPDFSALELFTGIGMPTVDHVVASANLISANPRDISARQLTVTATHDDVTVVGKGSIESIFNNGAVLDLELSSQVNSLSMLNKLLNASLPDIGPVSATAHLYGARKGITLGEMEATVEDDMLTGTVHSEGGYLNRFEDVSYSIELATPSVTQAVDKMGWVGHAISKPATLSSQLVLAGDTLQFKNTRLNMGDNSINGEISLQHFNHSEKRRSWVGNITVVKLDLMDVFGIQAEHQSQPDSEQSSKGLTTRESATGKILSNKALPLTLLSNDDVNIIVHIDSLTSVLSDVSDAELKIVAQQGVMTVGPFTGKVNEGDTKIELIVDTTTRPPAVTLNTSLDKINLARAGWFKGSDNIENTGGAWVTLSMKGQGDSVAQIMANATGEGSLYVEDLLFKQYSLSLLSSDLINQLIAAINPYEKKVVDTRFRCTAMVFQINNGQLSTPFGFAVESDNFSVTGDAAIDFDDEQLSVEFSSKPKHGLGISLNMITSLIKLQGSLSSPSLSVSQSGMLKSGASLAAAIASSGVTLLAQGLYEKHQANSEVCAKALGH